MWLLIIAGIALLLLARRGEASLSDTDMRIEEVMRAIAKAEGYYPGTLAWRNNNPGNLKESSGKLATYDSPEEGWLALRRQVERILTGESRYYNSSMTIAQIAVLYTGGDKPQNWAAIVAGELGVSTDASLASYVYA